MKISNLSVSPACITLTEKYTSQLLFITYASLFDNLNAQILDNTTPTRSRRHVLIITEQTEIVRYRYFFEFVTYRTIHRLCMFLSCPTLLFVIWLVKCFWWPCRLSHSQTSGGTASSFSFCFVFLFCGGCLVYARIFGKNWDCGASPSTLLFHSVSGGLCGWPSVWSFAVSGLLFECICVEDFTFC